MNCYETLAHHGRVLASRLRNINYYGLWLKGGLEQRYKAQLCTFLDATVSSIDEARGACRELSQDGYENREVSRRFPALTAHEMIVDVFTRVVAELFREVPFDDRADWQVEPETDWELGTVEWVARHNLPREVLDRIQAEIVAPLFDGNIEMYLEQERREWRRTARLKRDFEGEGDGAPPPPPTTTFETHLDLHVPEELRPFLSELAARREISAVWIARRLFEIEWRQNMKPEEKFSMVSMVAAYRKKFQSDKLTEEGKDFENARNEARRFAERKLWHPAYCNVASRAPNAKRTAKRK